MATIKNDANAIKKLLKSKKTATMPELKSVLNTNVHMTVIRKLKELSYITSYSDSGRYYTLSDIPVFDDLGLWSHGSVMFSVHGNLQKTVKAFVEQSDAGYTASELQAVLKVEVKEPLLILFRKNQVVREKVSGCYTYFSTEFRNRKIQLLNRSEKKPKIDWPTDTPTPELLSDTVKSAIWRFFSVLNEKQRRLYAGLESLKMGFGGDKKAALLLGLDSHTVAKGRTELLEQPIDQDRIRKKGGGRIPVEKKSQNHSPYRNHYGA